MKTQFADIKVGEFFVGWDGEILQKLPDGLVPGQVPANCYNTRTGSVCSFTPYDPAIRVPRPEGINFWMEIIPIQDVVPIQTPSGKNLVISQTCGFTAMPVTRCRTCGESIPWNPFEPPICPDCRRLDRTTYERPPEDE